jgi:hypothetical protein
MEFKTALKSAKKEKRSYKKKGTKVMAEQMLLPLDKPKVPVVDQFIEQAKLDEAAEASELNTSVKHKEHKPENAEVNNFHTARMNMLKSEIAGWCGAAAAREEKARNLTKEEIKQSNNEIRRQMYYVVYQEFDRVLALKLGVKPHQLSEYKLGKKFRINGKYIDAVEKAGYLDLLHSVVKQMLGK